MEPTNSNFTIIAYTVPFGIGIFILLFLTFIHKRVNWFILRSVLGVKWEPKDENRGSRGSTSTQNRADFVSAKTESENSSEGKSKSNTTPTDLIDEYLYIDFSSDDTKKSIPAIPWAIRLLSDVLAAAILGMFAAIIFQSLIMTNVLVSNGEKCPDSDAYCFRSNPSTGTETYNCTKGQSINSTVSNSTAWWCAGWSYQDKSINDVLGTIGTCGGLLGIMSSIVPFVYYLSFCKKHGYLSLLWFILPALACGALGVTIWRLLPQGISQLGAMFFAVLIMMVLLGWCAAVIRSIFAGKDSCISRANSEDAPKSCERCRFICCQPVENYPWCCIRTGKISESTSDRNPTPLSTSPVFRSQPERMMRKPYPSRKLPKTSPAQVRD